MNICGSHNKQPILKIDDVLTGIQCGFRYIVEVCCQNCVCFMYCPHTDNIFIVFCNDIFYHGFEHIGSVIHINALLIDIYTHTFFAIVTDENIFHSCFYCLCKLCRRDTRNTLFAIGYPIRMWHDTLMKLFSTSFYCSLYRHFTIISSVPFLTIQSRLTE